MIGTPSTRLGRLAAVALLLVLPAPAVSQQQSPLSRLDAMSRYQIEVFMDSAARLGIPPEALLSKTLEGISKGAPGSRIVQVVRKQFAALREARSTLGPETSIDELNAAAGALQSGVPRSSLATLSSTREGNSLLMPLVVLSDLVSRGVPPDDASSAIINMSRRGALDSDFAGLRRGVETDILSGASPATALDRRSREFPGRGAPGTRNPVVPSPTRPPETPSSIK